MPNTNTDKIIFPHWNGVGVSAGIPPVPVVDDYISARKRELDLCSHMRHYYQWQKDVAISNQRFYSNSRYPQSASIVPLLLLIWSTF